MVKLHYTCGSLERAAVDASFYCEVYALVKGSQAFHQFIYSLSFFHATEADVNFDLRLRRDHVASCSAAHKADIEARTARRIAHRVKLLGLAREFQNSARPLQDSSRNAQQSHAQSPSICPHLCA